MLTAFRRDLQECVRIGFEPMVQFQEIGGFNSAIMVALTRVIRNSPWRRLLDLRHFE